jgi:hypothetical protein
MPLKKINQGILNTATALLVFDDNTAQEIDFKPFLVRSHHPDIRACLDQSVLQDSE